MAQEIIGNIEIRTSGYAIDGRVPMRRARRGAEAEPSGLDALLRDAEFSIAADIALTPESQAGVRRRDVAAPQADFAVPVAPGEAAVLLVEDDAGVLHWRLPDEPAGQRRSRAASPDTLHFTITPTTTEPPRRGRRSLSDVAGWIGEKIAEPIRVRVLRFLVSAAVDAAVAKIEGNRPFGPVIIRADTPAEQWVPGAPVAFDPPEGRPPRILLLVHGTFSSTQGSFGALAGTPMFDAWCDHYDLILGHDHKTLAEDPRTNAEAMMATLHALELEEGTEVDAVAFSRGGLVYRTLAETMAPQTAPGLVFRRAVFIGCTNAGTMLAEPENWKDLADVYTNILLAGANLGGAVLGGGAALPWIRYAITTLGKFVQLLPQIAISERRLPGLAAMEPDGDVVTALNLEPPGPDFAARYFAVTSNFEPGEAGGLPARAAFFLADRVTDRLLGEDNDLVVHTRSMTDFGATRAAEEVFALDAGRHVFHTIYFATPDAMAPLRNWLGPEPVARMAEPEPVPPPSPAPSEIRGGRTHTRRTPAWRGGEAGIGFAAPSPAREDEGYSGRRGFDDGGEDYKNMSPADFSLPMQGAVVHGAFDDAGEAPPAGEEAPAAEAATEAEAPPPPETVERYIAAEMDPAPSLAKVANVYVTVSPEPISVADNAAAAALAEPARVVKAKPLVLSALPRSNCEVVGVDSCEVDPASEREQIVKFRVRGLAGGPAELLVEARQGTRTMGSFLLKPVFVDQSAPLRVVQELAGGGAEKGNAVLRIYEFKGAEATTLRFDLVSEDPEISMLESVALPRDFDMAEYAAETLKSVEDAWVPDMPGDRRQVYDSFLNAIASDAKVRTAELLPEKVRRALWKNRAQIDAIQVISEEPYIPWELLYLFDPDADEIDGECFFAEKGLVRWLHGAPMRARPPRLDGALSRYVVPVYANARLKLAGAEEEREMLKQRLPGIGELMATSLEVSKFLKGRQDCAILHFACHGEAQQKSVLDAALLMTGFPGSQVNDLLTWQSVKAAADFAPGRGPLVVINACQTGRGGASIAGTGGFADAFIRPLSGRGASGFVGALWSVDDQLATIFADTLYERLAQGDSLPAAANAARKACIANDDFTWLAYTVYTPV